MTLRFNTYNELAVPAPIRGTTDPEITGQAYDEGEAFFQRIREALGLEAPHYNDFFDIIWSREAFQNYKGEGSAANTELQSYRLNGRQTLLTVWDERDDANFHNIFFLKYPLTDVSKAHILRVRTDGYATDHTPQDL